MITASIKFLDNGANIDLPCKSGELMDILGSIGVLISPNAMMLDNARTVKIKLMPDETIGENVVSLINPTDTLGKLNKVCNAINCLDYRDYDIIEKGFNESKFKSLDNVLEAADRLREKRRDKENSR